MQHTIGQFVVIFKFWSGPKNDAGSYVVKIDSKIIIRDMTHDPVILVEKSCLNNVGDFDSSEQNKSSIFYDFSSKKS